MIRHHLNRALGALSWLPQLCLFWGLWPPLDAVGASLPSVLFYRGDSGVGVGGTLSAGQFVQGQTYGFSPGWDIIALTRDSAFFYDAETGLSAYGTMVAGVFQQTGGRQLSSGFEIGTGSCDTVALYDSTTGRLESRKLAAGILSAAVDTDTNLGFAGTSLAATCDSLLLGTRDTLDLSTYVTGTLTAGNFVMKTRFQAPSYVAIVGSSDTVLMWGGFAAGKNATGNLITGRFTPRKFVVSKAAAWPVLVTASRDSALIYSNVPSSSGTSGYHGKLNLGSYAEVAPPLNLSSGWTHIVGGK